MFFLKTQLFYKNKNKKTTIREEKKNEKFDP